MNLQGYPFLVAVLTALSLFRITFVEARRRSRRWRARRAARQAMTPERAEWIASDAFLRSYEWRKVRYEALERSDGRCECCGRTKHELPSGVYLNVDHIVSRRLRPDLALEPSNLQVLDGECNHGKGNKRRDWRARPTR